tara:strand:- start:95 stop:964 length:870 start_codon:yes stop_codon:yes gene_type:complete
LSLNKRSICPACQKNNFKKIYSLPYNSEKIGNFIKSYYKNIIDMNKLDKYEYTLLECLNCSLIFQEQIPNYSFSKELYEKFIDPNESLLKKEDFEKKFSKKLSFEMNLIKNIFNKNSRDISLLEFGAGWGFWSKHAQDNNFIVSAFEISEKRIDFMKKNKIKVVSDIKNLDYKYDLIYSEETFEHISHPKDTIIELSSLLKSDGYLLLRFPTTFLFKSKISENYTPGPDCAHPLEHINLFNKKSFQIMLKNTGLEIINFKSKFNFSFAIFLRDLKNLIYFDSVLIKKKY